MSLFNFTRYLFCCQHHETFLPMVNDRGFDFFGIDHVDHVANDSDVLFK